MLAPLLAIAAGFLFACSLIFVRLGQRHSTILTSVFVSQVIGLISAWTAVAIFRSWESLDIKAILFFVLAGISGPLLGRFFASIAVNRVGSSITSPIVSTNSLFATIIALLFLKESLTYVICLGVLLVVSGASVLSFERSGGQIEKGGWKKFDLIYPLAGAIFYAISHNLRKAGLNISNEPIIGLTIGLTAAMAFFPVLFLGPREQGQKRLIINKKSVFLFIFGGIVMTIAQFCLFAAFSHKGNVAIVSTLSSTEPVFVLILTAIFLKQIERITRRMIVSVILILAGVILLVIS